MLSLPPQAFTKWAIVPTTKSLDHVHIRDRKESGRQSSLPPVFEVCPCIIWPCKSGQSNPPSSPLTAFIQIRPNCHNHLPFAGSMLLESKGPHRIQVTGFCCTAGAYFSRAPSGTSSRNPASTGEPPSSEAASNIPFDIRPRILRGARLTTTTILRPTSFSGS